MFFKIFLKNIAYFSFPCVVRVEGKKHPALSKQKGGKHKKPHSQQEHKEHTFDSFCKQILKNERNDYHRRLKQLREHEVLFSELPKSTLEQFAVWDNYFEDTYLFEIMGFEIAIADELLAEALKTLPE